MTANYEGLPLEKIGAIQVDIFRAKSAIIHHSPVGVHDRSCISAYVWTMAWLSRHEKGKSGACEYCWNSMRAFFSDPESQGFHFITAPTFPMEEDGVRENKPHFRFMIHHMIVGVVQDLGLPHHVLKVDGLDLRLREALDVMAGNGLAEQYGLKER